MTIIKTLDERIEDAAGVTVTVAEQLEMSRAEVAELTQALADKDLSLMEQTEIAQAANRQAEELQAELRIARAALDAQGELTQKYQALALEAAQGAPQQHAQAAQHAKCNDGGECGVGGYCNDCHAQKDSHIIGNAQEALSDDQVALIKKGIEDLEYEGYHKEADAISQLLDQRAASQDSERDAARLDFVIANDAFVQPTLRDGTIKQYQLMNQDEDEDFHYLSGPDDRYFNSPREAIDAAMASQQGAKA